MWKLFSVHSHFIMVYPHLYITVIKYQTKLYHIITHKTKSEQKLLIQELFIYLFKITSLMACNVKLHLKNIRTLKNFVFGSSSSTLKSIQTKIELKLFRSDVKSLLPVAGEEADRAGHRWLSFWTLHYQHSWGKTYHNVVKGNLCPAPLLLNNIDLAIKWVWKPTKSFTRVKMRLQRRKRRASKGSFQMCLTMKLWSKQHLLW